MDGFRGPRRGTATVHREVWRVQNRDKRKNRRKEKASVKKQGDRGETLRYTRAVEG